MKTATISAIAALSIAAVHASTNTTLPSCDMGAIESKLLANGTEWHDTCTSTTGVDVFKLSSFPTAAQAKQISQSTPCVNYINQLNGRANSEIQCTVYVGDQSVNFLTLLSDFAKGETGNHTKVATASPTKKTGNHTKVPTVGSHSKSASGSSVGSDTTNKTTASSTPGTADHQTGSQSTKATSGAAVTTVSAIAAAVTAVLTFAL